MDTGNSPEVKRIAIVGPECTGKTALASFLAQHFQTLWVPEFARNYIEALNRPYEKQDLAIIARGQIQLENELSTRANKVIICDTNLIVIKIWSEFNYGDCDPEIVKAQSTQHYDLQLLTYIDIPWEDDPQREHPHQREQLYEMYKRELVNSDAHFIEIKGKENERRTTAIRAIEEILK
jgi:NadR type nicotinamide-nucleotide adenylyltransferase